MDKSTTKKSSAWHKKIAKNRGSKWQKNVAKGKLDAIANPTVLRIARLKKSLHQETLAKKVGLTNSTFGAIERGKRVIKPETAKKIAQFVGVPVPKLFKVQKNGKLVANQMQQSI